MQSASFNLSQISPSLLEMEMQLTSGKLEFSSLQSSYGHFNSSAGLFGVAMSNRVGELCPDCPGRSNLSSISLALWGVSASTMYSRGDRKLADLARALLLVSIIVCLVEVVGAETCLNDIPVWLKSTLGCAKSSSIRLLSSEAS